MNHENKAQSFIFEDQSSLTCCHTMQCGKMAKMRQTRRSSDVAATLKKNEIDQHLATTLKGLSAQERNAALEELNGVVDTDLENINEDPAVLDRKLVEMDQHLQTIKGGSVYERAESMNLDYVQNQEFRLKFLRSQRYDPTKAAKQVIDFFESKQWLFGEEKLCKDITLDDLSKKERRFLRKGCLQVLTRDSGGRMVITYLRGMNKDTDTMTELRCKYYTFMSLVESEETQKKGVIPLWYVVGDYYKDRKGGRGWDKIARLAPTLPLHYAGFHFCCDDIVQYALIRTVVLAFPKNHAAKFRCHKGTHIECMYALRTYGIPSSAVPIPETDANKPPLLYNHTIWYHSRERCERERLLLASLSAQRQQPQGGAMEYRPAVTVHIIPNDDDEPPFEDPILADCGSSVLMVDDIDAQLKEPPLNQRAQARLPSAPQDGALPIGGAGVGTVVNIVITPRRTDVLFGAKYMNHPGNLQLWQVISQQLETFESMVHRADKSKFVGMLLQHMKAYSGVRFLATDKTTNRWIEVDDRIARNKLSKAFHNKRRALSTGPANRMMV